MGYVPFSRSLEMGESPRLEAVRLQQTRLEDALNQAKSAHPTAEEMRPKEPQIDADLASLPPERQAVLDGITRFLLHNV